MPKPKRKKEKGKPEKPVTLEMSVLRYHTALQSCAGDPQKMASYCTAKGETLDKMYWTMVRLAHEKAGLPSPITVEK